MKYAGISTIYFRYSWKCGKAGCRFTVFWTRQIFQSRTSSNDIFESPHYGAPSPYCKPLYNVFDTGAPASLFRRSSTSDHPSPGAEKPFYKAFPDYDPDPHALLCPG